ncbi:MAG: death-on-curing family protein [Firmicutes bacterium]|nr:death-on-curing family protein [Bacillota bacterium]
MKLLDVEHILEIHEFGIRNFSGLGGLREDSVDKLESILAQQYTFFGVERYQSLFEKAAMLLYFLAKDHCFPDGNKRVAILAAIVLLDINGYETTFTDDEGYEMTMEVANSSVLEENRDQYIRWLANWLEQHSQII